MKLCFVSSLCGGKVVQKHAKESVNKPLRKHNYDSRRSVRSYIRFIWALLAQGTSIPLCNINITGRTSLVQGAVILLNAPSVVIHLMPYVNMNDSA